MPKILDSEDERKEWEGMYSCRRTAKYRGAEPKITLQQTIAILIDSVRHRKPVQVSQRSVNILTLGCSEKKTSSTIHDPVKLVYMVLFNIFICQNAGS